MKLEIPIPKLWDIPKDLEKSLSVKNIETILNTFNRASENMFVMMDYYREKLIIGVSLAEILTGHSQDMVKKEGLDFYHRILKKKEQNWLFRVNVEASKILYKYPENKRPNIELSYDLVAQTINRTEVILHHKLVPYQFCKNGNLWLALCFVTASNSVQNPKATIIDTQTGKKYDFLGSRFRLSQTKVLTREHEKILKWMANDYSSEEICSLLGISESCLKQKKRIIYSTLNVKTSAAATFKARDLGII